MKLSDDQVENIVRRSYQYVAMYNVNNKFALEAGRITALDWTPSSKIIRCGRLRGPTTTRSTSLLPRPPKGPGDP